MYLAKKSLIAENHKTDEWEFMMESGAEALKLWKVSLELSQNHTKELREGAHSDFAKELEKEFVESSYFHLHVLSDVDLFFHKGLAVLLWLLRKANYQPMVDSDFQDILMIERFWIRKFFIKQSIYILSVYIYP